MPTSRGPAHPRLKLSQKETQSAVDTVPSLPSCKLPRRCSVAFLLELKVFSQTDGTHADRGCWLGLSLPCSRLDRSECFLAASSQVWSLITISVRTLKFAFCSLRNQSLSFPPLQRLKIGIRILNAKIQFSSGDQYDLLVAT